MRKIKLIFGFMLISVLSMNAQNMNNPTKYKLTFNDIDQFQFKEMVSICSPIFQSGPKTKPGESRTLFYESIVIVTDEMIRAKLEEHDIKYSFKLNTIEDDK